MNSVCEKWQAAMLEAAVNGPMESGLAEHLRACVQCYLEWQALRERADRLQGLLPMIAQGAEPSPDFRARVLAATATPKRSTQGRLRMFVAAGAAAAVVVVLVTNSSRRAATRLSNKELATAQKLAEWRAPSDQLLATPGEDMLRTVPELGKSFLNVPVRDHRED